MGSSIGNMKFTRPTAKKKPFLNYPSLSPSSSFSLLLLLLPHLPFISHPPPSLISATPPIFGKEGAPADSRWRKPQPIGRSPSPSPFFFLSPSSFPPSSPSPSLPYPSSPSPSQSPAGREIGLQLVSARLLQPDLPPRRRLGGGGGVGGGRRVGEGRRGRERGKKRGREKKSRGCSRGGKEREEEEGRKGGRKKEEEGEGEGDWPASRGFRRWLPAGASSPPATGGGRELRVEGGSGREEEDGEGEGVI